MGSEGWLRVKWLIGSIRIRDNIAIEIENRWAAGGRLAVTGLRLIPGIGGIR